MAAFIATAFAQNDAEAAKSQWRKVADQLRPTLPKPAALMDDSETDVLAYMTFPVAHRTKLHSVNPLERLNGEIKRRTDVVGIFPNEVEVHPAALPRRMEQLGDGPLEPVMRIGDHQLDAAQAALPKLAQEAGPEGLVCGWPPACKEKLVDLAMIVACGRVSGLT